MRQFSVFCLTVVVASSAAILCASPVTSPEAPPAPATEAPVTAADEDLGPGAVLQDYEEEYEDADALADGDPEGEDMEAAGALIFRPLFAYRRKMERQARRRRERAHRSYHHQPHYSHGRHYYY
ncbi:uncharacterized protein LOC126187621 [Schistocerca cancellata]|uniref:uncharacterized protein LOC126187621 n=1 Tax=Schistocerca cancellata TaxID=274614 RepID=UPI0021184176|nr:uncharacterized protein LOC126187621 [Schistocerca cancellata]